MSSPQLVPADQMPHLSGGTKPRLKQLRATAPLKPIAAEIQYLAGVHQLVLYKYRQGKILDLRQVAGKQVCH